MPRILCIAILLLLALGGFAYGAVKERYLAVFRDGTIASTARVPEWHEVSQSASIAGIPLFDDKHEAMLLRDRHARPELRAPYVLLANGDVLPGTVAAYAPSDPRFGNVPTLYVLLEAPLDTLRAGRLAIRADRVLRIVASGPPLATAKAPHAALSDGRRYAPRSIRWTQYGLALLTDEGIVTANFAELADVLCLADRTQATLEDNVAAISAEGRIVRLTTTAGAVLTASRLHRYKTSGRTRRLRGPSGEPRMQVVLQPAWALEPISVLDDSICQSSFRRTDEAPLSLLTGETLRERGGIGVAIPWQRNAGAQGAPLASGDIEADCGLGTHAHSELALHLPPSARELSLWVGIDRASGEGGCVKCQIRRDEADGPVLWQSGYLRGRDGPQRVGPLDVNGASCLVLVAETAHEGRPAGADPLDIRDDVVWLSPLVTIDTAALLAPLSLDSILAGVEGWRIDPGELARVKLNQAWSESANRWDPTLRLREGGQLTFTRKHAIGAASDVLEFVTTAPSSTDDHDFELLVNGEPLDWTVSRDRDYMIREAAAFVPRGAPSRRTATTREDALHYWWDLSALRGREATIVLRLKSERTATIVWRSLSFRGAVQNLPASGKLPTPDISLATLPPQDIAAPERSQPKLDVVAGRRTPVRFVGQAFTGGYGLAGNSRISFAVQPEYRTFVALVGATSDQAGPLRILMNGRVAWESPTRDAAAGAQWIEVAVPLGTEKLTLETGSDGRYYGHAAFMNAGFMK